jgi:protease I
MGRGMLVEADVLRGLTLRSRLKNDIRNAGGIWTDRELVQDGQLTTSRMPNDISGVRACNARIFRC